MLKAGIVGLGKMGISHAAILGAHPLVDLVSVCDTSSLVLNAFKKYSRVNPYDDFNKMLSKEQLDLVVIATPTKHHYNMTKTAFDRNINVFCEKPFSLSTTEGTELVEIARQRSLVNQVGYHNHFIGTFREVKNLLDNNVIGEIVHFNGEAYGPVVTREKGSTWRSKPSEGGGCMLDYASHLINLIQEIVGRPVKVNGVLLKSIYSGGVDDAVYTLLTLDNSISGTMLVNWSDETYRKMSTSVTLLGKKGKIICDATEIKIFLKEPNKDQKLDKGWNIKYITDYSPVVNYHLRGEEYSAQIDYFIQNIINNQQGTLNTFEQGLYTDKVIEMIYNYDKAN
ncbi:gfo/Idh/MocA family oxidoreductase [Pontibacter diazotrophicus]|uniref:Gfo/Idh/MocA family oxidoreductase n=1 Tax=Pontibacter diazotrophicus TaxID=1400979 RepID=A0A3D8LHG2_9BACT|nr:Gfo/Idh/MocA family oxidoreductase [Pontibacter diazotrophicus]RDV16845.1 gfo/Idh/MocA family oxidoreductase [Pontibacter diazotrophicus]